MKNVVIILILLVGGFLRAWNLSHLPSGMNADEAALGYNAYSLLLTGKDEHGHAWPVNLESFGDHKPALYAYMLIPFVKFLGLNELTVRLPAAIIGIIGIYIVYRCAWALFQNRTIGWLSAAGIAIAPWSIHFSRGGWETGVATILCTAGVWGFIQWTRSRQLLPLLVGVVVLVLSMYTYQSARIIAPLLGIGFVILNIQALIARPLQLIIVAIITVGMCTPLAISLFSSDAASRFSGVGFTADEGPLNRVKQLRGQHAEWNSVISRVFHNRGQIYTVQFLKNYTDHFSGDFLFVNGDQVERSKVPETGLLYLTDAIFIILGIMYLTRTNHPAGKYVGWWLLVAPVAAALTFQTPSALRAQNMVVPLIFLSACGAYSLLMHSKKWAPYIGILLVVVYGIQSARYWHEYTVHYAKTYPASWQYGFADLVPYVESMKKDYQQVLITDKYDQPYILFLFYSQYPPSSFQNRHTLTVRDRFNFSTVREYDKYRFRSTRWEEVRDIHSTLIVAAPEDIPEVGVNVIKTFYFPSGEPAFKIVSN